MPDVEAARDAVFTFRDSPGSPGRYPPARRELLHRHGERFQDATFLFPGGTLDCLGRLRGLTSGPLTLLACDQYREGESFFDGECAPRIAFHGSFSIFVNFPILRDYFEGSGGFGIVPSFNYSGVVPFAAGTCSPSPTPARDPPLVRSNRSRHFPHATPGVRHTAYVDAPGHDAEYAAGDRL